MAEEERQSTYRNNVRAREMACLCQNTENQQEQSSQNLKIIWKLHLIDLNKETAKNLYYQSQNFRRETHYSAEAEYDAQNGYAIRSRPFSHDARFGQRKTHYQPYDRYARNRYEGPYRRRHSSYHEFQRNYSHPDQWQNEQNSAGMFRPGSSTREAPPRGMRTSRERTSSEVNDNNRSIPPSPRPSVNGSTREESDQNISNPPASQPSNPGPSSSTKRSSEGNATRQPVSSSSKPAETSAVTSQSIVPNSGENRADQSSRNFGNVSQATSTNENASDQQASPLPKSRVSFVKNLPSLVPKTILKKQSKQSSQKLDNESKIEKKDELKFIQAVSKNPHLYDRANPSYRDKEYKKKTWTSIGETFGHSADRCEGTWRSMRNRDRQWRLKINAGMPIPKEAEQFVDDMSFLHSTQESIQEKPTLRIESCNSDQALLNYIAAELQRLSPGQKGLLISKLHIILAEFSKAV